MKLEVPRYKNFNNYSCFVTTIAMILKYYGERINQKEIFEKAKVYYPKDKTRIFGCTVPSIMLAIKDKGYRMTAWHNKSKNKNISKEMKKFYKIEEKQIKKAEKLGILEDRENGKFSYIKKFLDRRIPVVVGVKSKDFYKGNPKWENSIYNKKWSETTWHVVVIVGYTKDKYIFNDSSPFFKGDEGKDRFISKKRLENACKTKAIFVLEKIKK